MEVPLTPLEFSRRTRALYADREALVDGDLRLSYEQFFHRCDRWSAALQGLGVRAGDRVAYIAPNTHAQLESFYGVPQIGAVLVPMNYRRIGVVPKSREPVPTRRPAAYEAAALPAELPRRTEKF